MEAAVSLRRKRIAGVFKDQEIDGHSQQFRDTFVVSLLASGVSLEQVATLLGNSVKVVQKHYAPWKIKRQEALDRAISRVLISIPVYLDFGLIFKTISRI